MAKKRQARRRRAPLVYLPIDVTFVLGSLADNTAVVTDLQTLQQDFHVSGIRAKVTFSDATAGDGPIETGWAQSQLTITQIVANRDASPTSQWDVLANEQSKRKVRVFGQSDGSANNALNNGLPVWRRMFLKVPAGQPLAEMWVLNRAGAGLTTGQLVHMTGHVAGRWA